jgi:hypothetical protein
MCKFIFIKTTKFYKYLYQRIDDIIYGNYKHLKSTEIINKDNMNTEQLDVKEDVKFSMPKDSSLLV